MFRRHRHLPLILATALLAGQWLSAAHESEHALQPGAAHACAVCLHADGSAAGPLPAFISITLGRSNEGPALIAAADPRSARLRHHPIRGPPELPA